MSFWWSPLQAYGDAVKDEAPLFAVSTYNVTFFLKRDTNDVSNKVLYASPPVCWNGAGGIPPYAAWLFFLQHASQLTLAVKQQLSRDQVPSTPRHGHPRGSSSSDDGGAGGSGVPGMGFAAGSSGQLMAAPTRKQPDRAAKRQKRPEPAGQPAGAACELEVSASSRSSSGTLTAAFDQQRWLETTSADPSVDAVLTLPERSYGELGITGAYLGGSDNHRVFQVGSCKPACLRSACMRAYAKRADETSRLLPGGVLPGCALRHPLTAPILSILPLAGLRRRAASSSESV